MLRAKGRTIVGQLATTPDIVGCYMLRPFGHPVASCCVLLGVAAQSLKPVKRGESSKYNTPDREQTKCKKKKKKIRCPVLPVLTGHEYLGFFFVSLDLLHCKYTELILSFPFRITSCAKSLIEKNSLHNDLIIL